MPRAAKEPLDLSGLSTPGLRWAYGVTWQPELRDVRAAYKREIERRGETLDGPAERAGGQVDGGRWRGRISHGTLVSEDV